MTEKLVVIGNGMAAGRVLDHVFERDASRYSITMFGAEPRARELQPHYAFPGAIGREGFRRYYYA